MTTQSTNKAGKDGKSETKRLSFRDRTGKKRYIRLGNVSKAMARRVKTYVEKLVSAHVRNVSPDEDAVRWLESLSDDFHARIAKTGLIAARRKVGTLGEMIPKVIKEKSVSSKKPVKPATLEIWGQSQKSLYRYFGQDKSVDKITSADAIEFCKWLAREGSLKKSSPLKQSTVAKRIQHVYSFFRIMKDSGDIPSNPFKGLTEKAIVDDRRNRYIEEETILKVMEYAPDAEWRLMIALWRFAGLRAASEGKGSSRGIVA